MDESRKTIIDQMAVFIHRKWLLIVPLVLGGIVGLAVSFELTEKYSSTTLVVVEEQQVPEEYVTPTDRTPFSQRLNVISQQILSRTKLEQIIKEFNLYEDSKPSSAAKTLAFITGKDLEEHTPEDIIERMRSDIQFIVVGETTGKRQQQGSSGNAFTITYSGHDPQTTMQVTNILASLFIEENLKVREQYAEGTSEFLASELSKSELELAALDQKIKDFKQAHMGRLPEQLDANLRTLDRLQLDLQNVTASLRQNEDRRLVLDEQLRHSPAELSSPAVKSALALELERARAELGQLLSVFRETYPDVVILKRRIRNLESQFAVEPPAAEAAEPRKASPSEVMSPAYSELMAVKSQLTVLSNREKTIRESIAEYQRRVEAAPSVEQQQSDLMRDYQISIENYQGLLAKRMNATLAVNLEKRQKGARFRVVDPANLPQSPDYPNKPLVSGIGLASGGALGAGLVLLFEFLNPAFRKPEDFEGVIDAPVLTSIPLFPFDEGKSDKTLGS